MNGWGDMMDDVGMLLFMVIVMNEYKRQQLRDKSSGGKQMQKINVNLFKNRYDRIGFNIKKKPKMIRLVPLGIGSNIESINRIQQDLMRDIRDIDQMLQKRQSNMQYIHGFLFTLGITKQLIKEFYSALQVAPDAVQDGFYLWRLREYNENYELVSSKLIHSPRHFPQKLLDKSIENLMSYEMAKHEQSVGKGNKRWNMSVKVKSFEGEDRMRRIKTDFEVKNVEKLSNRKYSNANIDQDMNGLQIRRKMTDFKQVSQSYKSHSHPLQLQSYVETKRSKQLSPKAVPQSDEAPSLQQLSVMLKKEQQVVSIWLPPSTCPQLMGIMSIQIKQKSYNVRYCLIKKYYWYRHGLSRRFFDSILQWTALQYDSVVQLALVTSRDTFNSIFSTMGWHLASWISDDKIKISYSGF